MITTVYYRPCTRSVAVHDVCPASLIALTLYCPESSSVRSHSLNVYTPSLVDDIFTLSLSNKLFPSRLLQTANDTQSSAVFESYHRRLSRFWLTMTSKHDRVTHLWWNWPGNDWSRLSLNAALEHRFFPDACDHALQKLLEFRRRHACSRQSVHRPTSCDYDQLS